MSDVEDMNASFSLIRGIFYILKIQKITPWNHRNKDIDLQRNGDVCVPMFNYKKNKMLVR